MPTPLANKTVKGIFWSFFDRIAQQFVSFGFSITMARLLLPEQFGLIAMLMVFIVVGRVFIESGFGQALIQKQDATKVDESSIFYLNIFVSFLTAGLLCLSSPWIALFYKEPILSPLMKVLSLNLVISAFGIVQLALLMKRVDFKTQMKISLIATTLSGCIGICMAYSGFGVWSIVAQSIGFTLFQTILLWCFNPWRPILAFSLKSLKTMFPFGSKLLLSGLLNSLFENIYLVVIGKTSSAGDLGFYTRARNLQTLPVSIATSTVNRVTFPVFASVQNEKQRLKNGVRKVLCALALTNFPIMVGLAAIAHPLIIVLLTEKWLPCVPYLQLLCLVGILYPLYSINLNVLAAQGRSDLVLRLEIYSKSLQVIAIAITFRWGISALIIGQIATSIITFCISTLHTGRLLNYPLLEQIKDYSPALISAIAMGCAVWGVGLINFHNLQSQLAFQVISGAVFYVIACYISKPSFFVELQELVKRRLHDALRTIIS